jgi:hypothetical protein
MTRTYHAGIVIITLGIILTTISCGSSGSSSNGTTDEFPEIIQREPLFQPPEGVKILIIGQDLPTIGGLNGIENGFPLDYTDGYMDASPERLVLPTGLMTYTSYYNEGLTSPTDVQDVKMFADAILNHPDLATPCLNIGYHLVDGLAQIASGDWDDNIRDLADWIAATGVPVFLRIGFEFNGAHNGYEASDYVPAYRRIVHIFQEQNVTNCAYVWHSLGLDTREELEAYYPGDEYVDWAAYSHFLWTGDDLIAFAEEHNLPVMIAEATPMLQDLEQQRIAGTNAAQAAWFEPLFNHIAANPAIQALCYINTDWPSQEMWETGSFETTDARMQEAPQDLIDYWNAQFTGTNDASWITGNEDLSILRGWSAPGSSGTTSNNSITYIIN